jgi:hypothetical protein
MPKGMMLKSDGFTSSLYDLNSSFILRDYYKKMNLACEDISLPFLLKHLRRMSWNFKAASADPRRDGPKRIPWEKVAVIGAGASEVYIAALLYENETRIELIRKRPDNALRVRREIYSTSYFKTSGCRNEDASSLSVSRVDFGTDREHEPHLTSSKTASQNK